jgi:tetratricopeptide (TPR) repeat protein
MPIVLMALCSTAALAQDSLTVLYNNLAVIYANNQEIKLAETYLDSARQQSPQNTAILNNIANCMLCRGQYSMALEVYRQILHMETEDKGPLFNMSVALYISDSIEASINAMEQFLHYAKDNPKMEDFASTLDAGLSSKGDAKKLTQSEIDRLLNRAIDRMKKATAKKSDDFAKGDSLTADSGDTSKCARDKLVASPAGAKAVESRYLSGVLYWIIL